ncbi:hypothetical protein [Mycolicibacterium austroafricanum]|uniref:hypothetical protein n=1 Tax=Mycolicibacterium austroafricanum TaxID=39687 RepID=UPI001CA35E4E|nr:hypothetical protein [Mycolicibacterium austroafricanum]QZT58430.1 hypothetical protein JN084_07505 [Mycolicibacterium austroafricanum]
MAGTPGRVGVRVAFLLVFAFSIVSLICYGLRTEMYPALTMPPFPGHPLEGSTVTQRMKPSFVAHFRDGTSETVSYEKVTPARENGLPTVFPEGLLDHERATDPRTRRWLDARMTHLYPSKDVRSVTIQFTDVKYDISTHMESTKVVDAIEVNLQGAG